MSLKQAIFNWSGGKDSALALYTVQQQQQYHIVQLLTSVNKEHQRVSMHGVRLSLLKQQSQALGLPLDILWLPEQTEMSDYEVNLKNSMQTLSDRGIKTSIFGDIFLEDLKAYREMQLSKVDMQAVFPLWGKPTSYVVQHFIDLGFKAIITAVDANVIDQSFVGEIITPELIKALPKSVDPCGENGEFHSFVFDGPNFNKTIHFKKGKIVHKTYQFQTEFGFWFCDLIPANEPL
ncbi:MAG: diphthine--ammonia ligase [Bacteroidales bacterium]|nr:diphthine--ammonia ligase [Bacteroidales bacterium]